MCRELLRYTRPHASRWEGWTQSQILSFEVEINIQQAKTSREAAAFFVWENKMAQTLEGLQAEAHR